MKKIILILLTILGAQAAFAQKWEPMRIDDSVQVSLPEGYTTKDTLGQTLISATSAFGNVLITKQPDNPSTTPQIDKLKHLDAFYSNFVNNIRSSSEGTISNEKDTVMGKLRVRDLTLEVDSGSGKQFRHIRILHTNSSTYTFQFLYKDIHKEYAGTESDQFFNSIKIPPEIGVKSQFTDPANTTGKTPAGTNLTWVYVGAGLLLVVIVIIILVRRKRRR